MKYYLMLPIFIAISLYGESNESEKSKLADQFLKAAGQEGSILFTPPEGWGAVDPQSLGLSEIIKAMVIGKGKHEFPPSMNLAIHPYGGTIKDYLKEVKKENDAIRADFKDLGNIQVQAGDARLCQVDFKTKYGEVREMHLFLLKEGTMFVLTAGALKEEFPKFYNDFFSSMRSLRFNTTIVQKDGGS